MGSFILSAGVLAIGVAIGMARGGTISALRSVRPRWWGLLAAGFGLQALAENVAFGQAASVAVIGMFALVVGLAINAAIRGALITAFGVTLNLVVLVVNGSVPIRFESLEPAGLIDAGTQRAQVSSVGHLLELETASTRLGALGDTIPVGLLGSVISIGDLVTFAGVIVIVSNLLASKRQVGVDVDAIFAPAPFELDLEMAANVPAPTEAVIDVASGPAVIDVSKGLESTSSPIDLTYEPDDVWADDEAAVQILGPSSPTT